MHDQPKAVSDDDQALREWIYDNEVQTEMPNIASGLRLSMLCMNKGKQMEKTLYGGSLRPVGTTDELVKHQSLLDPRIVYQLRN